MLISMVSQMILFFEFVTSVEKQTTTDKNCPRHNNIFTKNESPKIPYKE
jgi:hypothetical protein